MIISWSNIDDLEDCFITYLLYRKALTVPQISKIRNKTDVEIRDDLIKAKQIIRDNTIKNRKYEGIQFYLTLPKEKRLDYIQSLSEDNLVEFKRDVYRSIRKSLNNEDLLILLWTAGELRDDNFLELIYPFTEKKDGNLRRIAYSALGKIGSPESRKILEKGLFDKNPQVRQYSAKALRSVGDRDTIIVLEKIVNKADFEKEYVIRSCKETLNLLYSKYTKQL